MSEVSRFAPTSQNRCSNDSKGLSRSQTLLTQARTDVVTIFNGLTRWQTLDLCQVQVDVQYLLFVDIKNVKLVLTMHNYMVSNFRVLVILVALVLCRCGLRPLLQIS